MSNKSTELTPYEIETLQLVGMMPRLDATSQVRIRRRVNQLRAKSPAFEAAFGGKLSGLHATENVSKVKSALQAIADVVTHPIQAAKDKVGETLLKHRNKVPEILVHPNTVLTKIARPWDFRKEKKEDLIEIVRMLGAALRSVDHGERLGMAAPQIGILKRVFVCQGAVCVNPTFTPPKVVEMVEIIEGCYSIPNQQLYKVKRAKYGWATFFSVDGVERRYKLTGLDAIVFQHELDHLNGRCACDIGELYTPDTQAKS